jgi:hypothetical protein
MKSRLETLIIGLLIVAIGVFVWHKLDERATRLERSNEAIQSYVIKQNQQTILLKVVHQSMGDKIPVETKVKTAQTIYSVATVRNVPLSVICAVIENESRWIPNLSSEAGAHGLMQVLGATARPYLRADKLNYSSEILYDPVVNVLVGISVLADLHEFHMENKREKPDDYNVTLHSYFWGSENTRQLYGVKDQRVNVPNMSYPQRVLELTKKYKDLGL